MAEWLIRQSDDPEALGDDVWDITMDTRAHEYDVDGLEAAKDIVRMDMAPDDTVILEDEDGILQEIELD